MCIILVTNNPHKDLTPAILENCEKANPHGIGISWTEDGVVQYRKGIDGFDLIDIIETLPENTPTTVHFRFASVGQVSKELEHPFRLDASNTLLSGTSESLLFHNGTIQDWRQLIMQVSLLNLPGGDWSDTRALAWVIYNLQNINILNLYSANNRFAVHNRNGVQTYGDWIEYKSGLLTSTWIPEPKIVKVNAKPVQKTQNVNPSWLASAIEEEEEEAEWYQKWQDKNQLEADLEDSDDELYNYVTSH